MFGTLQALVVIELSCIFGDRQMAKCHPLFPAILGGHMLSLANYRFSRPGLHPTGPSMSKTLAKSVTRPVAIEQSTCINWFVLISIMPP